MKPPADAKDIPGWPGYRIEKDGNVWSCRNHGGFNVNGTWLMLKQQKAGANRAHRFVVLCAGTGKPRSIYVHHLMLLTFVGPWPDGMEALHKNDIQWDNRVDNLMWGTHKQNCEQRLANGRQTFGEDRRTSKLTNKDVLWIRENPERITYGEMAKRLKVRSGTVRDVAHGRSWRHLLPKSS